MHNSEIAEKLLSLAHLLELEGENRFKVQAYRRAAKTINGLSDSISELVSSGESLTQFPGIGKGIAAALQEIVSTGELSQLKEKSEGVPAHIQELAKKPRLDAKKVLRIYKKLGISSLKELEAKLNSGELLEVCGERLEFHVRQGMADQARLLLYQAEEIADELLRVIRKVPLVKRAEIAGSLRRKKDTVGDLRIVVETADFSALRTALSKVGAVGSAVEEREDYFSAWMATGILLQVQNASQADWGFRMLQATGSAAHLEALSKKRRKKELASIFDGIETANEESAYRLFQLPLIAPELREGRGEVEAGASKRLPKLVTLADLRGDLHCHTVESDGRHTLEEMAEAAELRGYEYLSISNHSQRLKIAGGMPPAAVIDLCRRIDKFNQRSKNIILLKSAEVDILEDGSLDYDEDILRELDIVVCSIHSKFQINKDKQTARILKAMDNSYFDILGHATGRILLSRQAYGLDIERIIRHALERGCYLEINADPHRLDLSDEHAKLAKDLGLKLAVSTDAHSIQELDNISYGINQARRAWLTRDDLINSRAWPELKKMLRKRR